MKKSLLLFILIIILFNEHSKCQSVFKNDYYLGSGYYGLLEYDNKYVFAPQEIVTISTSGINLEWKQILYDPFELYLGMTNFDKYTFNKFYYFGSYRDSCPGTPFANSLFVIADSTGHAEVSKHFEFPNCTFQYPLWGQLNDDYTLTIGGRHVSQPMPNYFAFDGKFNVFKVDSALDSVLWVKTFSNHWGQPSFCKELYDKTFILGMNLDTAGACLAKLDSMGNVLWCKSYFRPKGMITDAVVDTDGNVMCVGLTDTIDWGSGGYPPWYHNQLFLMKVDTGGNVVYCKGYNGPSGYYYWRPKNAPLIRKTLDGNFMLGGTKFPYTNNNTVYGLITMLMKIDGNGDTLWTRGFGAPNRSTQLSNFISVSDGGYLLSGDFNGAISWPFGGCYVYKTDSLGYTSCGNLHDPISISPLFPVDSNVVLLSVDDSVTVLNANITDTIYPFPATADDCIVLGVPQPQQNSGYNIYPNPTKGEFKIEIQSPLKRDSFITVYNSMGKIILQHAIKTQKDLQLDLTKYGKGIYLVKVREGDKESSSKVVVE